MSLLFCSAMAKAHKSIYDKNSNINDRSELILLVAFDSSLVQASIMWFMITVWKQPL